MENDELLRLDHQLCFPLYAAARKTVNLYTPYLKPLGITSTQYLVFLVLWEEDGLQVGELCRRLYLDNGTMTPLLKKMAESGYVTRQRQSDDERRVVITLTDAGKALKQQAKDIPLQVGSCIRLSPEEAGMLYTLLYRLLEQENA